MTQKRTEISRRQFIQGGAALAAAAPLGRALAQGAKPVSANEKIQIGVIAPGRRGNGLLAEALRHGDKAEVVALADVNMNRIKALAEGKDWGLYQDYREMLARNDIDAVIIASPDHWHALHSIHACEAGKDVYVEKPMTLFIKEGRAMVDAARKHGRIVQVGSQQRSMPKCRLGCELVRNGRAGEIHTVHGANYPSPWECPLPEQDAPDYIDWDMWCGPTEPRGFHPELYAPRVRGHDAGWISYITYSGGEMTGWGAHGLDIIQWALGMDDSGPVKVWPLPGTEDPDDKVHRGPTCQVEMQYANGVMLKLDGEGGGGGGVFEGSEGTIAIDRGRFETTPGKIGDDPLPENAERLYRSDDHMGNWLDCVKTRDLPIADVAIGHRSTTVCHLGNIARWTMRELEWDPAKEEFVDDEDANSYLERPMRAPYTLDFG